MGDTIWSPAMVMSIVDLVHRLMVSIGKDGGLALMVVQATDRSLVGVLV